ncbi:MAG: universal stress protein [Thermoproteota archaeon]|nr:universal stress protein [Thermoproteota archaeon]
MIALHVIHSEIKHVYFTYSSMDLSIKGPLGELYRMLRDRLRHGSIKFKKKPMKTTLRRREIIVNSRLIVGVVVDYAEHEGVDLIVMGSRGLSGFKKLLLGSTASGVVTYAHCPVLVVNEQKYTS